MHAPQLRHWFWSQMNWNGMGMDNSLMSWISLQLNTPPVQGLTALDLRVFPPSQALLPARTVSRCSGSGRYTTDLFTPSTRPPVS